MIYCPKVGRKYDGYAAKVMNGKLLYLIEPGEDKAVLPVQEKEHLKNTILL
jgi:hypothetical protein